MNKSEILLKFEKHLENIKEDFLKLMGGHLDSKVDLERNIIKILNLSDNLVLFPIQEAYLERFNYISHEDLLILLKQEDYEDITLDFSFAFNVKNYLHPSMSLSYILIDRKINKLLCICIDSDMNRNEKRIIRDKLGGKIHSIEKSEEQFYATIDLSQEYLDFVMGLV